MSTKYTKEILEEAVSNSSSYAGVIRYLGLRLAGGTQSHIAKKIREYGINTSHFTSQGHNKGKPALNRKSSDDILIVRPDGSHRESRSRLFRSMVEQGIQYACARCTQEPEWNGRPLTLDINHIDGNFLNNVLENLEFVCPNCHTQEDHTNMPHKYRDRSVVTAVATVCPDCGGQKQSRSIRCKTCAFKLRKGVNNNRTKIEWPSNDELLDMLALSNYTEVARRLGVSRTVLYKRLAKPA